MVGDGRRAACTATFRPDRGHVRQAFAYGVAAVGSGGGAVGSGVGGPPPGLSVGVGSAVGGAAVGAALGAPLCEGVGVGAAVGGGGAVQVTEGSFVFVGSVESSGIVPRPTGSVPACGNARFARSWIRFIRGMRTEPRGSAMAPCTSGYWITARKMWSRGMLAAMPAYCPTAL